MLLLAAGLALAADAREIRIEILHTADVHGNVFSSGLSGDERRRGGLLRCATLVAAVRAGNPHAVLLDIGDLFQGTAESLRTRGMLVADVVKSMRYDGLVIGNHEFDWGAAALWSFYQRAGVPVLAADIFTAEAAPAVKAGLWPEAGNRSLRPDAIQPFFIRNIQGVRLAVIGLSNPHMPHWFKPDMLGNLVFLDSVVALRGIMPKVREAKPDILVLAVHQGYRDWGDNPANAINRIAANFPELTAIIGAHSHVAMPAEEINGVLYTQTEPYASSLGKLTVTFDLARRQITGRRAELLPADAAVPPDPRLLEEFGQVRAESAADLDQIIGTAACDHTADPVTPGQSRVQSLIAAAVAERTGADVVLHGTLTASAIYAGAVRVRDVWRIVPYENTIGVAQLTLEELGAILAENSRYFNSPQFRGVYGATYRLDFAEQQPRISAVKIQGAAEPGGRRYPVAFNSFDLASAGDRFPLLREITERPGSRLADTGLDTRQIVMDYIARHPDFDILSIPPESGAMVSPGRKPGRNLPGSASAQQQ